MISYIKSIRDKMLSIFSFNVSSNLNSWIDLNSTIILYINNLMAHLWYKLWAPKTICLISINSIVIQRHYWETSIWIMSVFNKIYYIWQFLKGKGFCPPAIKKNTLAPPGIETRSPLGIYILLAILLVMLLSILLAMVLAMKLAIALAMSLTIQ